MQWGKISANIDSITHTYLRKHRRGVEQVQKQCANAAIHIEHQVGSLRERVAFHCERVVKVANAGEELSRILLQQLHSLVAVVLSKV